jgi:hypothetical protein
MDIIENIHIKPIIMPHHQRALRENLLTASHWKSQKKEMFLFWKGGEEIMKKKKFATIGIALCSIAFAVLFTYIVLPNNTKTAYAEQVAEKTFETFVSLPEDKKQALQKKFSADAKELLQQAKTAKDLKMLTYEEFADEFPLPPAPDKEGEKKLQSLQFLQFTDKDGGTVVLGIDKDSNLPLLVQVKKIEVKSKPGEPAEKVVSETFSGGMSETSPGKIGDDTSAGFQSIDGGGDVMFKVGTDGNATVTVNGKKYKMPEGVDLTKGPPQIKVEGENVYINGTKATLEE